MSCYGDGREERLDAEMFALRLARSPKARLRKEQYDLAVSAARYYAKSIGNDACISELIKHNPAYIKSLLDSEDDRFGAGSIAVRYAQTFWPEFAPTHQHRGESDE